MPLSEQSQTRMLGRLRQLYGDEAAVGCLQQIGELAYRYRFSKPADDHQLWSERDVVLITYGDQVRGSSGTPLAALTAFLKSHVLDEVLSTVHILPFFEFSSDDGFSVIDYRQVDPQLGSWDDVAELGRRFDLMFDLVLNHCSRRSRWFEDYLKGRAPYDGYFIEVDPTLDLSAVTRPRNLPLLTPFETSRGTRHIWTTFSDDQVDLNFSNPDMLIEMLDILLFYVSRGARIIRLDAIAYLWKQIGTSCIHLPETHAVVKLMRDVLDELAPGTILLTETNVPHDENVSYFGNGDEAQMVYQFSLAPLLLDAFLSEDARPLMRWLSGLESSGQGTTFFNFTASHDGIGVRPLEGLVERERLDRLVEAVRRRGGLVSTKRNADGSDSPYELNITWFSALGDPAGKPAELHVRRFLTSQSIMLALKGIPGIYFHSLIGTENDLQGVEQTGRARTVNRRKFDEAELDGMLADKNSTHRHVFEGLKRMISIRIDQPAFHPDAEQTAVDLDNPSLIAFRRTSLDGRQEILVVANVSHDTVSVELSKAGEGSFETDLLSEGTATGEHFSLPPYEIAWLSRTIEA